MITLKVLPQSTVTVHAASTLHGIQGSCSGLSGELRLESKNSIGEISFADLTLPLKNFSSGSSLADRARNFAMHKHIDTERYPYAYCRNIELFQETELGTPWKATITYRERQVEVSGVFCEKPSGEIQTSFSLQMRSLGISPPSFLFLKVEEQITIHVTLMTREIS